MLYTISVRARCPEENRMNTLRAIVACGTVWAILVVPATACLSFIGTIVATAGCLGAIPSVTRAFSEAQGKGQR